MAGRRAQYRVQDDQGRNSHRSQQWQDFVAVGSAVGAVLVLHDYDIAVVEQLRRAMNAARVTGDQLTDNLRAPTALWRVDDANHSAGAAGAHQLGMQGRGERSQTAKCRRVGAYEAETDCHKGATFQSDGTRQTEREASRERNCPSHSGSVYANAHQTMNAVSSGTKRSSRRPEIREGESDEQRTRKGATTTPYPKREHKYDG
jgi:hypothetical protein